MGALDQVNMTATPQSEPIPGKAMVANAAGGFVFEVDDLTRLRRFLILGVEGGTFYVGQDAHVKDNVEMLQRVIKSDGVTVVGEIIDISVNGRAPSNTPAVFALAAASVFGDDGTRKYAFQALTSVCRTGTHLFEFAKFRKNLGGGWGRGARKAVAGWYESRTPDSLAYQAVKYRQRHGWTHRDLLRIAHPKSESLTFGEGLNAVYDWITHGNMSDLTPDSIVDFEILQRTENLSDVLLTLRRGNVPWEAVPTQFHKSPELWRELIEVESLPTGAMIRQLGRMSSLKVGKVDEIVGQLTDRERLHKSRIHPIKVLLAMKAYGAGSNRNMTWVPETAIMDALDDAFYASFKNVEPAGKRTLIGLDVSGSMGWGAAGGILSAREATAAMAMVQVHTEPHVDVMGFSSNFIPLDFSKKRRLDDIVRSVSGLPFGATDCSLPMLWAHKEDREYDTFVIYTDNETWSGSMQPVQALDLYRRKTGIDARLIVAATEATYGSIADPNDAGMLDVVGFDASVPTIIAEFSGGRV